MGRPKIPAGRRRCATCKAIRSTRDFYAELRYRDGLSYRCKACDAKKCREYFDRLKSTGEWHNGADVEIHLCADSLQRAAKCLVERLDPREDTKAAWDTAPIILLYRQAVELGLKALVGEGAVFLKTPTDHITLYKTHSLPWLAQIVCQILEGIEWQADFKRDGISSMAEFRAFIAEFDAMDPVFCAIQSDRRNRGQGIPERLRKSNVLKFISTLDALIGLLGATADALASTKDLLQDQTGPGAEPTVH